MEKKIVSYYGQKKFEMLLAAEKQARIGFIGCGMHATVNLYPCIPRIPEIDLVAVADLDKELAEITARNYGARRAYASGEEMLEKEELDGVIIVGHPKMQCELGKKALEMGIPTFIEKPLAIFPEEVKELMDVAERNNTWGQVAYCKRFAVACQAAKEIIEDKEKFGRPSMLIMKFSCGRYAPDLWKMGDPSKSSLIGHEVHMLDLARFFFGELESVRSTYFELSDEQHGYCASLKFRSGAIGSMNIGTFELSPSFDEYISLSGDEAFIVIDQMLHMRYHEKKNWVDIPGYEIQNLSHNYRPNGRTPLKTEDNLGFRFELEHFAKCCLSGTPASPSLYDAYKTLQFAYAIHESAHKNRIVELSD